MEMQPMQPMEQILYERALPHGPTVRIRRTSETGMSPVIAVLEIDRRAGTPRASQSGGSIPPALLQVDGPDEGAVMERLTPLAADDAALAKLLREKGLR
jgi:hypothetical protein